jgi:hypothetical protein
VLLGLTQSGITCGNADDTPNPHFRPAKKLRPKAGAEEIRRLLMVYRKLHFCRSGQRIERCGHELCGVCRCVRQPNEQMLNADERPGLVNQICHASSPRGIREAAIFQRPNGLKP